MFGPNYFSKSSPLVSFMSSSCSPLCCYFPSNVSLHLSCSHFHHFSSFPYPQFIFLTTPFPSLFPIFFLLLHTKITFPLPCLSLDPPPTPTQFLCPECFFFFFSPTLCPLYLLCSSYVISSTHFPLLLATFTPLQFPCTFCVFLQVLYAPQSSSTPCLVVPYYCLLHSNFCHFLRTFFRSPLTKTPTE